MQSPPQPHSHQCVHSLSQIAAKTKTPLTTLRRRADRREVNGFPSPVTKTKFKEEYCLEEVAAWLSIYLATRLNLER